MYMVNNSVKFVLPQQLNKADGSPRRVGYELEFAGLELDKVVNILAKQLDAKIEAKSQAESIVFSESLGKFKVELDWQYAKETAAERAQELGKDKNDDKLTHWLTKIASQIVPVEIVCPPIAIEDLHKLEPAINQLTSAGALGTDESILYAFGVHINPELPDLTPGVIANYLKAYSICQDWLIKTHQVDPVRRVTPYINPFPDQYIKVVLSYDDKVTISQLIDDYLEHNPTRNRALDVLPLFKFLDENKVLAKIGDDRVNARPTFHYRLPNCEIDQKTWSLAQSWNIWSVVESLANRQNLLTELSQQWFEHYSIIQFKKAPWHKTLDQLYQNLLSA